MSLLSQIHDVVHSNYCTIGMVCITCIYIFFVNYLVQYFKMRDDETFNEKDDTNINSVKSVGNNNTDITCSEKGIQTELAHQMSVKIYPWKYWTDLTPSLTLCGHSRAAEASCFYSPQLKTYFDAGKQGLAEGVLTLLTHGHLDHSGDVWRLNLEFDNVMTLMVPKPIKSEVENFIRSACKVNNKFDKSNVLEKKYKVIGVEPYTTYMQMLNKRSYLIETYECYHSVPTIGYGMYENRKRIKKEYADMTSREIADLKKKNKGLEISTIEPIPIIAYIGDTTTQVLEDKNNQNIFRFPFIVIESTFFGNDSTNKANRDKHIHWNYLRPYVLSHPDNVFVLIHFSTRHKDDEIYNYFENDKEEHGYSNIIVWLG